MIFNMVGGGGGSAMNFTVKDYASADALPSPASDNAIAVITGNEIKSWVFSATEPESPSSGLVWFEIGLTSDVSFNALKKNALVVCLSRAYQYIGGAFSPVEAYLYNGTSWVDFSSSATYLYIEGDTCDALTGGYYAAGLRPTSNQASNGLPTITYGEETMTITGSNDYTYNGGYVRTKNKIDLTDFSKLVFEGNRTGSGGAEMVVWTDIGSYITEKAVKLATLAVGATSAEIDVSGLTGLHYIGFMTTKNGDGVAVITVLSLGLE